MQSNGLAVPDATFMASVATYEEKGSDVNVAPRLLVDVLAGGLEGRFTFAARNTSLGFPDPSRIPPAPSAASGTRHAGG